MSILRRLFGRGDAGAERPPGSLGEWATDDEHRANKQRADTRALEVEGDPRGGLQDGEYRGAGPTDVVEAEGVAMSGPGGAPVDDTSPGERRDEQR